MTGQELIDHTRIDVLRDNSAPFLWSDDLIKLYLSAAENEFSRKTYALLDNTKTIVTEVGTGEYDLPAGSIYVASARISTDACDMGNYTRRVLPSGLSTATGTPSIFVCDEAARTIRFYLVPDAIVTINLRVARLPAAPISEYNSPEIPEEYHLDLASYAAWKCLQNNDVDGQNITAADRHKADWNLKVADAKREYYRFRMGVNPRMTSNWTGKRR